ncbi:MAG TPA: PAS domain S-box protein, partial [Syntrophales bacterium]|nr:PAS domain S-box protein [Syntrophales bacterium]
AKQEIAGFIPIKITLIYALAGGLWIFFSDLVLSLIIKDPDIITRLQIFKGWLFIGATAVMLYLLIRRALKVLQSSELALRESEEKFQMLVETTASAIFIYRDRILHANLAMEILTGYKKEELLTMNYFDIVHPDFRPEMQQHCEALCRSDAAPLRCEHRILKKSGEERWVDFTSSVIIYDGEQSGLGTAFDITDLKKTMEALRESEERFRLLIEGISDYEIFMLDPQGRIMLWNVGAEQSKGYAAEEVVGRHHSIFFTQQDVERGIPDLELKIAAEDGRYEDEGWRVRKNGSHFWANVVTTVLRDDKGLLRGFSKVVRDITERKRAEETLRESEERYRVIAETASDAIITINEDSEIIFANPATEKIFGFKPGEIIGQRITKLMPERLRSGHLAGMKRFLETGRMAFRWEALELPGLHSDGREIPLEISYGVFIRDGERFFTGIVRDIAERKQAEKEKEYEVMLERFNQELETIVAERTMNLMALKLADSVRNPAAVIGWTGRKILEKWDISEKSRDNLTAIIEEAEKL